MDYYFNEHIKRMIQSTLLLYYPINIYGNRDCDGVLDDFYYARLPIYTPEPINEIMEEIMIEQGWNKVSSEIIKKKYYPNDTMEIDLYEWRKPVMNG